MNKWLTHIVPAFAAVIPSVGAVLVAANTLSVAWTGTTGSLDTPDTETMVLTLLDYDASSCSTNCELSPCSGAGAHLNESTPFGNDGGEIHECVGGSGCYPHQCDPTYTLAPDSANPDPADSVDSGEYLGLYRSSGGKSAPESGQTGRSDHGVRGLGLGLGRADSRPTA